jgi:hypothetical protein
MKPKSSKRTAVSRKSTSLSTTSMSSAAPSASIPTPASISSVVLPGHVDGNTPSPGVGTSPESYDQQLMGVKPLWKMDDTRVYEADAAMARRRAQVRDAHTVDGDYAEGELEGRKRKTFMV